MPISVEELFQSYGAYLRAKVQLQELDASYGTDLISSLRKHISEYEALERDWIAEQLAKRRLQTEHFKEQLEGKRR